MKGKDVQFISSSLYKNFRQQLLAHLPPSPVQIVLGYSGGLDSELMASFLAEFARSYPQYHYLLVHVHHGLHPDADQWLAHCQQRSAIYQLPFHAEHVVVPLLSRTSLEAKARERRYEVFNKLMDKPSAVLLTAHHADDQLETMLLSLKRGCGVQGFSGMKMVTQHADDTLHLRPFLLYSRSELAACVQDFQLPYVEDSSNQDLKFDRNFLRQVPIAQMQRRWPHMSRHAHRLAEHMQAQLHLIEELVDQQLGGMVHEANGLCCRQLSEQSKVMQQHLVRRFIQKQQALMPTVAQLDQVLQQVQTATNDTRMLVTWGGWQIRCYQKRLYLLKQQADIPSPRQICFQAQHKIDMPDGCYQIRLGQRDVVIEASLGTGALRLQFGAPSALMCHPHYRQQRRSYKKLMQELNIPPWQRARVPLLFSGDRLIAAIGLWIEQSAVAQSGAEGWYFVREV